MPEPDFKALYRELLKSGIMPRHARRAQTELQEHYADLVDAFGAEGVPETDARRKASRALGQLSTIVGEMSARRELKTWAYRYPYAAVVFYPLACLVTLPATPVIAGVEHASIVARWGASLLVAGLFTLSMLLVLQLFILFG